MILKPISLNYAIDIIRISILYKENPDKYYFFFKDKNDEYHKVQKIDLLNSYIICDDGAITKISTILKSEGINNSLFIKDYPNSTQCCIKEQFLDELLNEKTFLDLENNKFLLWSANNDEEYVGIAVKGKQIGFLRQDVIEYIE
jgi:hypothetical protein